jgi:hypothetical protein
VNLLQLQVIVQPVLFGGALQVERICFNLFVRSVDTFQPVKFDLEVCLEKDVYICDEGADLKFDAWEW